jgi:hypothetical protein
MTPEDRQLTLLENQAMRDGDEYPLKGGYKLIFPNENVCSQIEFGEFIEAA